MEIGTTLVGRIISWIPAPWSGVRLGSEVKAKLCTHDHPLVFVVGAYEFSSYEPLHVDVEARLWNKGGSRTTVRAAEAKVARRAVDVTNFEEVTLDPGGGAGELQIRLRSSQELTAAPGDGVKVKLLLTRGRPKTLRVRLDPEEPR